MGDYFYLECLFQSSGVLPGYKHGIHNTVKNNHLIEQKAWERGDSQANFAKGLRRGNLYPETLGRVGRVLFQTSYGDSKELRTGEYCP